MAGSCDLCWGWFRSGDKEFPLKVDGEKLRICVKCEQDRRALERAAC